MTRDTPHYDPRMTPQGQVPVPPPQGQAPQQPTFVQVRRSVHHSYIWLGSLQAAGGLYLAFFIILFANALSAMEGAVGSGFLALLPLLVFGVVVLFLLIFGLVLAGRALSYRHLYYELTDKEFNFHSGILNKKRIHVPYQRVQSLDQKASFLQRIAGVCTVRIDTAGGSNNTAIYIPYMLNSDAEWLRNELFTRKNVILASSAMQTAVPSMPAAPGMMPAPGAALGTMPGDPAAAYAPAQVAPAPGNVLDAPADRMSDMRGVFGGSQVYTGIVTYEYGLSNKELLLTGLSNNTTFVVIVMAVLGVLATVIELAVSFSVTSSVVDISVNAAINTSAGVIVPFVAIGLVLFLAFIWFVALLHSCLAYGGFKARRRDRRIEVEHGLLQHHFSGLDIDRVQSVIIKQSFIRRILGYCELSLGKIDALEQKSDEHHQLDLSGGLVIHPFVKLDRVPEILAGLVPEYANVPTQTIPVAPVALRRAIIRRSVLHGSGFWLAVFAVLFWVGFAILEYFAGDVTGDFVLVKTVAAIVVIALVVVLFACDVIAAVMWYRGSSFAFNRDFMQISNSGFSRESVSFPRKKIQFGFVRTNPLQRRAHVATIHVRTAAGIMGSTLRLMDVSENDADAWLEWMKPGGNVLQ